METAARHSVASAGSLNRASNRNRKRCCAPPSPISYFNTNSPCSTRISLTLTITPAALDGQFDPLLVAFNRDVAVFLRHLQEEVEKNQSRIKSVHLASNGIITLRTISGTDSEVATVTQNSFKNTPPPLVQDFLKQFSDADKNVPDLLKANLAPHAAAALVAFLNSGQSSTVTLGRDMNLKISPVSLQGAGAAELKIHLESKDDGAPQLVAPDGTAKNDTTDRIAQHTVDTNIRVDSLKIFEVSSFSAALSKGREPIPILPPFVELPYIGSFLKLHLSPSTVYHRSFAIVSAVMVPTAADLLSGTRFHRDSDEFGRPLARLDPAIREYHRMKLSCIVAEANPENLEPKSAENCRSLVFRPSSDAM
jgi:hypothetical protein